MASGSSWSRFPPITLSGAISDRFHPQDDDRYAAPIGATIVTRAYEPNPVTTYRRRAGLTVLLGTFPRCCPVCCRAGGAKLERPQPRSGEDERA
jgi:hypothetical protein